MGDARTLSLMENGVKLPFERVILRQKLVATEVAVAENAVVGAGWSKILGKVSQVRKSFSKKICRLILSLFSSLWESFMIWGQKRGVKIDFTANFCLKFQKIPKTLLSRL